MAEAKEKDFTDRSTALREAYRIATNTVRSNHLDEFNRQYQIEAKKLGHDWSPKLSDEEKAAAQFDQLLKDHPEFAERVAQRSLETEPEGSEVPAGPAASQDYDPTTGR